MKKIASLSLLALAAVVLLYLVVSGPDSETTQPSLAGGLSDESHNASNETLLSGGAEDAQHISHLPEQPERVSDSGLMASSGVGSQATPAIAQGEPIGQPTTDPADGRSGSKTHASGPSSPVSVMTGDRAPNSTRPNAPDAQALSSTSVPPSLPVPPQAAEQEVPVPPGSAIPAAIVAEPEGEVPEALVNTLDSIADEFLDKVTQPGSESPENIWRTATNEANERYRSIYGIEAFNRWTTQAAKDALKDR